MTARNYTNTATEATLTGAVASSDGSFTLTSFSGFPAAPFTAAIERGTAGEEIVLVTAVSASTVTATRGYDGTTAKSHAAGSSFLHVVVAKDYAEANTHVSTNTAVHGVAGNVVGTSDVQTLSNKTLISPTISAPTVTGTAGLANASLSGGLTVAGATTLAALSASGNASVGGTLTVTGASTLAALTAASAAITGNATVGGSLTVTGAVSGAAVTGTTVTGSGLLKGAGLESSAGLALAQIAAPSGVASKGQVWAQSDGGLYTRAGTAAVGRVAVHWGSGTTPPATGALAGDRYLHTQYGPMTYTGTAWLPTSSLHGFLIHANSSQNVAGGGSFTFTFPALPASIVAGMRVRGTLTVGYWNNNAATTQLGSTTITATNGTLSGADGAALIVPPGDAQEFLRPIYLDVTAASPVIAATVSVSAGAPTVTFGPVRIDFSTGYAA